MASCRNGWADAGVITKREDQEFLITGLVSYNYCLIYFSRWNRVENYHQFWYKRMNLQIFYATTYIKESHPKASLLKLITGSLLISCQKRRDKLIDSAAILKQDRGMCGCQADWYLPWKVACKILALYLSMPIPCIIYSKKWIIHAFI